MARPTADLLAMGSARANQWRVSPKHVSLVRAETPPRPLSIAAEPQSLTFDLARSALVVVDMQNDFCAKGGYLDYRGVDYTLDRRPIEPIRRIVPQLRAQSVPIVWLNWGVRPDLLNTSPSLLHAHTQDGSGAGLGQPIPAVRRSWSKVRRAPRSSTSSCPRPPTSA